MRHAAREEEGRVRGPEARVVPRETARHGCRLSQSRAVCYIAAPKEKEQLLLKFSNSASATSACSFDAAYSPCPRMDCNNFPPRALPPCSHDAAVHLMLSTSGRSSTSWIMPPRYPMPPSAVPSSTCTFTVQVGQQNPVVPEWLSASPQLHGRSPHRRRLRSTSSQRVAAAPAPPLQHG